MTRPAGSSVPRPPATHPLPPSSTAVPNNRVPPPAPPLINPTGNPTLDAMAGVINSTVSPFQNAPPPEQGAAGAVAHGLGAVTGLVGAPTQLIDTAFASLTAPIAALFPAMPAITLLGMHLGMLHTHTHPPSLVPPAPPIPLPSIGMLVGSGSMSVLGCGMPLARAGDIGISVTCGSLAPPFEVFTGSSNVFVGGARAARILDITKHCDPTAMGPFGIAMSAAGIAAGAAGAIATNGAALAAQAAADAAVLALKLLCGKDPGLPPGVGALLGPPLPTVMIGGFPCPPIGDMVMGALMRGLKAMAAAAKKLRSSRRANGNCANGSHPIYLVTGENFDEFTDFVSGGLFVWKRHYTTARARLDGPLGFGFRHFYQRHLAVRLHRIIFIDWDGVELEFPGFGRESVVRAHGYVLRRVTNEHYELSTRGEPTMVFEGDRFTEVLPLAKLRSETRELELDYDSSGWLVGAQDRPLGQRSEKRYTIEHDARGRIIAIVERASPVVSRFAATYTSAGELAQVHDAGGGLWAYEYDDDHRWIRQIDPRSYAYSFRYDERGRCVAARGQDGLWEAEIEYRPDEGLTRMREGEGAVWEYHYDHAGFITKIVSPLGGVRKRERDPEGRILCEIDAAGRVISFLYDHDGAHFARLDRFGNLHPPEHSGLPISDPLALELPSNTLERLFGGVVSPQHAAMLGTRGRLLHVPPELRALAQHVFRIRQAGKLEQLHEKRVWRDPLGRVVYETDELGRGYRQQFDAAGNVWRGDRKRDIYEYDKDDRFVARLDGEGQEIFRNVEFHANALVARRKLASGGEHRFEYDQRGRTILASTERDEVRRGYAYQGKRAFDLRDERGVVRSFGAHSEQIELVGLGRQPLGEGFCWSLVETSDSCHVISPLGRATILSDDGEGMVLRECSNGTREWLQFDDEGRLLARLAARPSHAGHLGWATRHGYSAAGDLLTIADSVRGTTHYETDAAHRLVAELGPRGDRYVYEHDAADNLISQPGLSRLEIGWSNHAMASAIELFEHDPRDRLALRRHQEGGSTRYVYDSFDMLVSVERAGVAPWTARYDALGRRLACGTPDATREFYWDGDRLAAEIDPRGRLRIYLYASHAALVPLGFVDYPSCDTDPSEGREYSLFCDASGMPLHVEDETREIVWWVDRVAPFGALDVHASAKIELNLRWPGHYFDAETGLHYNRWRYYDPALARYLQPDPIGFRGSEVNLYGYCPNPLVGVDLLGLAHKNRSSKNPDEGSSTPSGQQKPPVVLTERQARTADSTGYYVANDGTVRRAPTSYVSDTPVRTPAERAAALGYDQRVKAPPFDSHGQPVYTNGRTFITPDVDGHNTSNGWKMFDRRGDRTGTHDANLTRLKD